jgi:hypothetical protein
MKLYQEVEAHFVTRRKCLVNLAALLSQEDRRVGAWVDPRGSLDAVRNRKISHPRNEPRSSSL